MSAECSLGNYRYLGPSRHTKKEKNMKNIVQLIFGLGERYKLPQWGPGQSPGRCWFWCFL